MVQPTQSARRESDDKKNMVLISIVGRREGVFVVVFKGVCLFLFKSCIHLFK